MCARVSSIALRKWKQKEKFGKKVFPSFLFGFLLIPFLFYFLINYFFFRSLSIDRVKFFPRLLLLLFFDYQWFLDTLFFHVSSEFKAEKKESIEKLKKENEIRTVKYRTAAT